jgi:signal transduction histidine kinase
MSEGTAVTAAPAVDVDARVAASEERRRSGLRWLVGLRWWAMAGAMAGVLVALALSWSFVHTPAIVGALLVMVCVNAVLMWRSWPSRAPSEVGRNELLLHAGVDLALLTWLLAWAGGLRNPLSVAYAFHVVLGALLNGRRGALTASGASFFSVAVLFALEQTGTLPTTPLREPPDLLWALALSLLVAGLSYLSLEVAERERAERERAEQGQEDAERGLDLLLAMLAALKVGVEVKDRDGRVLVGDGFASPQAVAAKERAAERLGQSSEAGSDDKGERVTERFTHTVDGKERVIELVALRPNHPRVAQAFLSVDRTEGVLVEQRHIMLERLATLGRAMQGVAHELNTPLTTMQTLAKDMQAALADVGLSEALRNDVDESLKLLIEESRRCRSLTQALLQTANDGRRNRGTRLPPLEVAKKAIRLVGAERDAVYIDDASFAVAAAEDAFVDADRVLQILMNLIQNALAATASLRDDGKGARVVVAAARVDDIVTITVEDRGPGLPDTVRAHLFEPFVTTKAEGTGLGLYTSQQLARDLGGSLVVGDVGIGTGTRAVLTLPQEKRPGGAGST